ncbi:energy transducer TonB [Ruegeria faecimaris]|uniref:energy transducer TonB n=1 Tax=Ruegeria faecimaris TaxID=686389 RepID=UPI002493AF50|nr:TonB family protein [Ruegeria faecimaris]
MITKSRVVVVISVALAVATHGLALLDYSTAEQVQVEGGGEESAAALGSVFKDFVAGTNAPAPASTRKKPAAPHRLQPKARPVKQQRTTSPQTLSPVVSSATAATAVAPSPLRPQDAETPNRQGDAASVSPTEDAKPPEPKKQASNQTATAHGNAKQSGKKGDATGKTTKGAAKVVTSTSALTASGNADASNYAGQIKRKIIRARRKSANIRGAALVAFRIAENGTLQAVGIVRSSGSKRLDQIALAQVKAAAPFPPPPAGVRRDYTFEIIGQR